MSGHKPWREVRRGNPNSPESVALRDAVGDAIALAEIRERRGLTQVDVARAMQTSQASVSKLERREDLYLSTLRDFVTALGGRLELSAVFPDGRMEIGQPAGVPWKAQRMRALVDLEDKEALRRTLDGERVRRPG